MDTLPVIRLTAPRAPGHPWIWSSHVAKPAPRLPPGTVVDIHDAENHFVGRGFWNGHARVALRVLTTDPDQAVDADFITERIARAVELRRRLLDLDRETDAWRAIHAEGDGLSGLVVDRYADTLSIEYFAAGMWRLRAVIEEALQRHFSDATLYSFAEKHVQKQESFDCQASPPPQPVTVHEHGRPFLAAPGSGHKTGFFADQRANRMRFAQLARGRHVLDLCCNGGGFAIHALASGAASATGVDADAGILEIAERNAAANDISAAWHTADIFDWLKDAREHGTTFDAAVLDPSRLTRSRRDVPRALKKYFAMNRMALDVLAPGAVFLTCSCTGLVNQSDFLDMLRKVSHNAGRAIHYLDIRGAGSDHPVAASVPEGRYLKAVFCRVD